MNIDFGTYLLDPLYGEFGVPASLTTQDTGNTVELTVIDKTAGVTIPDRTLVETVKPCASVRVSELTAKSIARVDLADATIAFNGGTWTVTASHARPTPGGEGTGEYLLVLSNDA